MQKNEMIFRKHLKNASEVTGFEVIRINANHFGQVEELNRNIMDNIANPDFYYPPCDKELLKLCLSEGLSVGIFSGDHLIAYQMTYFPEFRGDNLGLDIRLPKNRLKHVANFHGIAIHSEYRNKGFGSVLTECVLHLVRESGCRDILATCHPDNIHSLRILQQNGFRIRKLKNKYGGMLRYVLHKELNQEDTVMKQEIIGNNFNLGYCA